MAGLESTHRTRDGLGVDIARVATLRRRQVPQRDQPAAEGAHAGVRVARTHYSVRPQRDEGRVRRETAVPRQMRAQVSILRQVRLQGAHEPGDGITGRRGGDARGEIHTGRSSPLAKRSRPHAAATQIVEISHQIDAQQQVEPRQRHRIPRRVREPSREALERGGIVVGRHQPLVARGDQQGDGRAAGMGEAPPGKPDRPIATRGVESRHHVHEAREVRSPGPGVAGHARSWSGSGRQRYPAPRPGEPRGGRGPGSRERTSCGTSHADRLHGLAQHGGHQAERGHDEPIRPGRAARRRVSG